MTIARFTYQSEAVAKALKNSPGKLVLNVGCNDDPASLKSLNTEKVVNCDLYDFDPHLKRPNNVDELFDCGKDVWPFEGKSVSCVVLGDIVEHLQPNERLHAFREANRVSDRLVVTCPNDDRLYDEEGNIPVEPKGLFHVVVVGSEDLKRSFASTGWRVEDFQTVDYDFAPEGYFVTCKAQDDKDGEA